MKFIDILFISLACFIHEGITSDGPISLKSPVLSRGSRNSLDRVDTMVKDRLNAKLSHFALAWPRKGLYDTPLSEPDFGIEIGQELMDQIINADLFHLITDKLAGFPLPLGGGPDGFSMTVQPGVDISNVRIRKLRADGGVSSEDISVVNENGNEKIEDNRSRGIMHKIISHTVKKAIKMPDNVPDSASNANVPEDDLESDGSEREKQNVYARMDKNSMRIVFKGLVADITADYALSKGSPVPALFRHSGKINARTTDAAFIVDLVGTYDAKTGQPMIIIKGKPQVYLGKLDIKFEDVRMKSTLSAVADYLATKFGRLLSSVTSTVLQSQVPALTKNILQMIATQSFASMDQILGKYHYPPTQWPDLNINDMRINTLEYRLVITGYIEYNEDEVRARKAQELQDLKDEKAAGSPMTPP